MSKGIRQVHATLLGARHVPERLCGGSVYWGAITSARPFTFLPFSPSTLWGTASSSMGKPAKPEKMGF